MLHRRSRLVVLAVVVATSALWLVPGPTVSAASADTCPVSGGSVKVGVAYFGAVAGAYSDIGGDTTAAGANPDQSVIDGYKAGIKALNDSGGIAGCTVEPVVFNFSAQSPDYNQMSQQECAAFSQDNKVIAVYTPAYETKVAVDCLAKAKVPYFGSGTNYQPTCADAKAHKGIVYSPAGVYTCRFSSFIKMWDDAGLFPKDAKVGIMVSDDGSGQGPTLADKVYTPQLKKLGIPVETFKYTGAISSASFGAVNATVAQAVLKFKNDGVNVVLFTPVGGQGVSTFMPQAATQGYYPNYGVTSADSLVVASGLGADRDQEGDRGVVHHAGPLAERAAEAPDEHRGREVRGVVGAEPDRADGLLALLRLPQLLAADVRGRQEVGRLHVVRRDQVARHEVRLFRGLQRRDQLPQGSNRRRHQGDDARVRSEHEELEPHQREGAHDPVARLRARIEG